MELYMIVTASTKYGARGYPVALVGGVWSVAQSGYHGQIVRFRTREAAERVRRSFPRPADFAVRPVEGKGART